MIAPLLTADDESADGEQQIIERYWDILVKSPKRGATFDRVYNYYVDTGQGTVLLDDCRKFTQDDPNDTKAWLLLGLVAERRSELTIAAEAFQIAAKLDPDDPTAPFYLGGVCVTQGRFRDAVTSLEESAKRAENSSSGRKEIRNILQTLGRVYERFSEPKKSAEVWNKLERLFPDDPEILVQIAELLESEGKWDEALKRYEKLAAKNEDDFARVRFTLSGVEIKLRQNKEQDALADLNELLDNLAPESWLADSVRERINQVFVRSGNEKGLVEFYRKRIDDQPNDTESVRRLAKVLKPDEAEKLLTETIEKSPSNVPLRLALLDLDIELKKIADAVSQIETINELEPNNVDYLSQWGSLVLQNKEIDESIRKTTSTEIWSKIAEIDPDDPLAAVTVADLLFRNKIYEPAEQFYQKALELQPDDFLYREHLAKFYHARHQKEKVLDVLRPMAEGESVTVENFMQLGNNLLSLGYTAESFDVFHDAAEKFAGDLYAQWRYIEALVRRGKSSDMELAAEHLTQTEKLLENDEQFAPFLKHEIQLLQSLQKLSQATTVLETKINHIEPARLVREFWRLAMYRQAVVKLQPAINAAEQALKTATESKPLNPPVPLLRLAAELYEQAGNNAKAMQYYRQLIKMDTASKIDYLKQLANAQSQAGQLDAALETCRELVGIGAGNAANVRFYANLLIGIGRYNEAIDLLQQSLRKEPGETETLKTLAQTLISAGRDHESLEMSWRLFERTDHLPGKLTVIENLTADYQRLGQLDTLIERLERLTRFPEKQHEASLCLARVYAALSDYESCRQTLESLLNSTGSSDPFLLRELVAVAAKQSDDSAAVRFQELLCQQNQEGAELDRLFKLYDRLGETEKAQKLFLDHLLRADSLKDKLDSIDSMIRREEYGTVKRVLDFLEIHEPDNWEVPFRRLALEAFLGEPVELAVREFRSMNFTDQKIADEQSATQTEKLTELNLIWQLPGTNFPGKGSMQPTFDFAEVSPAEFQSALRQQRDFLATLFRERLYSPMTSAGKQPKPFIKVETFRDARFLTVGWLLKESLTKDLKEKDSNPTVFRHFRNKIEELRDSMPIDSSRQDVLIDRLRFEVFLLDLLQLDRGQHALVEGRLRLQIDADVCNRTIWQLVRQLGMEGTAGWQVAAFQILVSELIDEKIFARFGEIKDDELEERLTHILDEDCTKRKITFSSEDEKIRLVKFAMYLVKQSLRSHRYSFSSTGGRDASLLHIWSDYAQTMDKTQIDLFEHFMAPRYPVLRWLLDKNELSKLDTSLEQAAMRNPVWFAESAAELSIPVNENLILFLPLSGFDPLDRQFERTRPMILKAISFCRNDDQKPLLRDAAVKSLGNLLEPARLRRFDFFTPTERDLLGSPPDSLREMFQVRSQTTQAQAAKRLFGLSEYRNPVPSPLKGDQTRRVAELEQGLYKIIEFAFQILDELQLNNSFSTQQEKTNRGEKVREGNYMNPLSSYRAELVRYKSVDRSMLYSLLQDPNFSGSYTAVEDFFFRMTLFVLALDTKTRNAVAEIDGRNSVLPGGHAAELRRFLENKGRSTSSSDRAVVANLRETLDGLLWKSQSLESNETPTERNDEISRMTRQLETQKQNRTLTPPEMLALALLRARSQRFDEIMPILDEMELKSSPDTMTREWIAAEIATVTGKGEKISNELRQRGEVAVNRLLGYRLTDRESLNLIPILQQYDRKKEAQEILDRLIVTTSDRNLQTELLNKMKVAGPEQRDNAVKIANRLLQNPAFLRDTRRLTADSFLIEAAVGVLKNADQIEPAVSQLETRLRGLRSKTDSRIMLAKLYLALERSEEAKKLAIELSLEPSNEPERRQMIISLLLHFGLQKELDAMNRRLVEMDNRP
jgi:tetratricopeptide (TPR) repeat protein